MTILDARNITKRFAGVTALDDVSLSVGAGETHCIVGENGAGKSTLVKILTGLYRADEGTLVIEGVEMTGRSSKAIAYVPQELNLFEHLTVAENIFMPFVGSSERSLLFSRRRAEANARPFMDLLRMECRPGDLVRHISIAERQLLQVARALASRDFRILILDEPTASLTKREIDRLFLVLDQLKDQGKAIIFISHRLDEVMHLHDFVTVLRDGRVVGVGGGESIEMQWIVRTMTDKDIDLSTTFRPRTPPGEVVLEVTGLAGDRFRDVSFELREGEILGFAGLVGAGRSEVMQTIFGLRPRKAGQARYCGNEWRFGDPSHSMREGLIYLPEERKAQGILPYLSLRHNVGIGLLRLLSVGGLMRTGQERRTTKRVIRDYNVRAPSTESRISDLSGGNQQRVLLGRSMEARPRVLLLDEPTRGIDISAKEEVYALMQRIAEENRIAIILISSELEELIKCCNRVITVYGGRINSELVGDRLVMDELLSSVIAVDESAARASDRRESVTWQ